jgi:hypothetical protein
MVVTERKSSKTVMVTKLVSIIGSVNRRKLRFPFYDTGFVTD